MEVYLTNHTQTGVLQQRFGCYDTRIRNQSPLSGSNPDSPTHRGILYPTVRRGSVRLRVHGSVHTRKMRVSRERYSSCLWCRSWCVRSRCSTTSLKEGEVVRDTVTTYKGQRCLHVWLGRHLGSSEVFLRLSKHLLSTSLPLSVKFSCSLLCTWESDVYTLSDERTFLKKKRKNVSE